MTDRTLPHACDVANRAYTALTQSGQAALADQLSAVHRATCDLVHALHAEREATHARPQLIAQRQQWFAIAHLRDGTPNTAGDRRYSVVGGEPSSPQDTQRLRDLITAPNHTAAALADTNEA